MRDSTSSDVLHEATPSGSRPDVVWVNGTFGVGKTSVVAALVEADHRLVAVDPEEVGYLLRAMLPLPTGDFRDLPAWRRLVVAPIVEVLCARQGDHTPVDTCVVAMTLSDPVQRAEVFGALAAAGVGVREVVLVAPDDVVIDRIRGQVTHPEDLDRNEASRRWRLAQLHGTTTQLHDLPPVIPRIETGTVTIAEVAGTVRDLALLTIGCGADG